MRKRPIKSLFFSLILCQMLLWTPINHAEETNNAIGDTNTSVIQKPEETSAKPKENVSSGENTNKTDKTNPNSSAKKSKSLPHFDIVNLSGVGNLYIKQTNKESSFRVEADTEILPLVVVYVKNKELYIDLKQASEHAEAKIDFYLTVKELKEINSSTSSTITIEDRFKSNELTINLSSFGDANINIEVQKLTVKLEGGSKIDARGIAEEQFITIEGAGDFEGALLKGKNAELDLEGTIQVKTGVTENLTVKMDGEGSVKYCGRPSVKKEIKGKATVSAANEKDCVSRQ